MGDRRAIRLLVSGVVQGVGYRDWARRTASELGLVGWVRNLADGRVEVWAEGERPALDALQTQAGEGPRHAHVTEVRADAVRPRGAAGFERRPTADGPEPTS